MNCINKIPLFNDCKSLYTGGICHKKYFLLLNPCNCEVDVYNHCYKKIGSLETCNYKCITENEEDCYFLLTKENDKEHIYKATYDFLEFDAVCLTVPNKYKEEIQDISYDKSEKRILVVTKHCIYSVTLDGYFIKEEASCSKTTTTPTYVRTLHGCCIEMKPTSRTGQQYTSVGICNEQYYSYIKDNECYIARLAKEDCQMNSFCLGKDKRVVSMLICRNRLYLLVIQKEKYNYIYETDICCCSSQSWTPCNNHCQNLCPPCPTPCPPLPPCPSYPCDPAASLLESVALVETALSHILNAEGEKIQKAIQENATIAELLDINTSVTDTLFQATMLEHVLHQKIEKALKYDDKKCCNNENCNCNGNENCCCNKCNPCHKEKNDNYYYKEKYPNC